MILGRRLRPWSPAHVFRDASQKVLKFLPYVIIYDVITTCDVITSQGVICSWCDHNSQHIHFMAACRSVRTAGCPPREARAVLQHHSLRYRFAKRCHAAACRFRRRRYTVRLYNHVKTNMCLSSWSSFIPKWTVRTFSALFLRDSYGGPESLPDLLV